MFVSSSNNISDDFNIKVSVIVPIYNVAEYLDKCIDSLIKQDYTHLEIILVNDGSTDGCDQICNDYRERDSRIVVLHKKNGGLMSAWKSGLHIANGDYIGFVDGDDWIRNDMYKNMVDKIIEYDTDIVCCGYIRHYGTRIEEAPVFVSEGLYFGEKLHDEIFSTLIDAGYKLNRAIYASRCNKLIRRELLINNVEYCYDQISYGEDLNIIVPTCLDAKSIYVMKNAFYYYYRQTINSLTNSISYKPRLWEEILFLNSQLETVLHDKGFEHLGKQLDTNLVYMARIALNNECKNKVELKQIISNMRKIITNPGVTRGIHYLQYDKMSFREILLAKLLQYKMSRIWFFMHKIFYK